MALDLKKYLKKGFGSEVTFLFFEEGQTSNGDRKLVVKLKEAQEFSGSEIGGFRRKTDGPVEFIEVVGEENINDFITNSVENPDGSATYKGSMKIDVTDIIVYGGKIVRGPVAMLSSETFAEYGNRRRNEIRDEKDEYRSKVFTKVGEGSGAASSTKSANVGAGESTIKK